MATRMEKVSTPMFHQPEPAARAWRRTGEFLARHLPVHRDDPRP